MDELIAKTESEREQDPRMVMVRACPIHLEALNDALEVKDKLASLRLQRIA